MATIAPVMLKRTVAPKSMEIGSATLRTINGSTAIRTVDLEMSGDQSQYQGALALNRLRHHRDKDRTPCRQHDIPNGIGHRVTQGRKFALRFFLDGAKGGCDRSRSGTSTEDDDRIHLQDIAAE